MKSSLFALAGLAASWIVLSSPQPKPDWRSEGVIYLAHSLNLASIPFLSKLST